MKTAKIQEINTAIQVYGAEKVLQKISSMQKINTESAITALMAMDTQNMGVRVAHQQDTHKVFRIYVGVVGLGIVANYDPQTKMWHSCQSHGNYGKNVACGGTWTHTGESKKVPQDIISMIKNTRTTSGMD